MKIAKKVAGYILSGVFWLLVWILIASIVESKFQYSERIFPYPDLVFKRLFELSKTSEFWKTIFASFARVVSGVLIAIILAILAAVGAAKFKIIHILLHPFNEVVKATPIVSFIFVVYILFWRLKSVSDFFKELLPVFIVLLIVFPVVYASLLNAMQNVERELIEVASVFGCTWFEKLRYIWIPTVLNAFITSALTSLGLGWKAGIAAEALTDSSFDIISIGANLSDAKRNLEAIDQFAWTVTIILISMIIGLIFKAVMNKVKEKIL